MSVFRVQSLPSPLDLTLSQMVQPFQPFLLQRTHSAVEETQVTFCWEAQK